MIGGGLAWAMNNPAMFFLMLFIGCDLHRDGRNGIFEMLGW